MKNRIRQILREETSGFDPKLLGHLYKFMNFLTKDYVWYHDTPEQKFKWTPGSIFLINPKTEDWVLHLRKDDSFIWFWDFYKNFSMYLNTNFTEYEKFITMWAQDALNQKVYAQNYSFGMDNEIIKDIIEKGKRLK